MSFQKVDFIIKEVTNNKNNQKVFKTKSIKSIDVENVPESFIKRCFDFYTIKGNNIIDKNIKNSKLQLKLEEITQDINNHKEKVNFDDELDINYKRFKWTMFKNEKIKKWVFLCAENPKNNSFMILGSVGIGNMNMQETFFSNDANYKDQITICNLALDPRFKDVKVYKELINIAKNEVLKIGQVPTILVDKNLDGFMKQCNFKLSKCLENGNCIYAYNI